MGKVVATYLVRITLREPDPDEAVEGEEPIAEEGATLVVVEEAIDDAIRAKLQWLEPNVSAERVDE